MVGTAQADNFAIFLKKIGYSVGLESLLQRAARFGEAYAATPAFRESDWTALVRNEWALKNTKHISDVFGSLGIAQLQNGEVYAGPIGEALGIVRKLSATDKSYLSAVRYLVLLAIVSADGDIFLNALNQRFNPDALASELVTLIGLKRERLFEIFGSERAREAISKRVTIEKQITNKGGGSPGGLAGVAKGGVLSERLVGLGLPSKIDIRHVEPPSRDYLRKVTVSRRGWAESLGLSTDNNLTEAGITLLSTLGRIGMAARTGAYLVWPTKFELKANRFEPEALIAIGALTTWEFYGAVFQGLGGQMRESALGRAKAAELENDVARVYFSFRELAQHRSMIRNEISIHVVYAALLGLYFSRESESPNLRTFFEGQVSRNGAIVVRPSQTIELAITIKGNADKASQRFR